MENLRCKKIEDIWKERMEEKFDKSDNSVSYNSKILLDGWGLLAVKAEKDEGYLIHYYKPTPASHDKREVLIRIYHSKVCKGSKNREDLHDRIDLVIDLKNHSPKMPFHLNISGLSKTICQTCPTCKKYFLDLNHFKVKATRRTGEPYKIIDWDGTAEELMKRIESKGFFQEFSQTFKHSIR